jgi:hypothetical protein
MATAQTIRDAARSQPFRPFRLRLIDGTEYDVAHPDLVSVPPAKRAREVLFYISSGDETEDERRWIDVGMISEVIIPPLAPPSAPGNSTGNGSAPGAV